MPMGHQNELFDYIFLSFERQFEVEIEFCLSTIIEAMSYDDMTQRLCIDQEEKRGG